jgi:hypothetical protein
MSFVHAHPDEEAGRGGEGGDHPDGGAEAGEVGDDAGEEGADGEPAVTPEPVDTDGAGAPGRVRDVGDGGEQRRVDRRRTGAEQDGGDRPAGEGVGEGCSPLAGATPPGWPTECSNGGTSPAANSHW